jgi:uncharacterized protein with von Willebrand factor type A (vWA) domain
MDVSLAAFVAELRAIGLPISVAENVDATAAVAAMPMTDRASLKSALAATLVKDSDHYGAFELVFEIFFGGRRVGVDDPAGPAADGAAADRGGASGNGAGGGRGVVAMLSDAELADLLLRAVLTGDRMLIRAVAAEAVTRYAGIEPGRAVAGLYYLYRTMRELDLDRLLERLLASAAEAGLSEVDRRLAGDDYRARVDAVRTEVEAEIRRRLVADRGPEAVAGTLRKPLPEDADFLNASKEQLAAIRQAVQILGRKLAARLARKRRHQRRSALDFRRTVRRSLSTGGVPVDLVFRKPHPAKPEVMLIADISSSVAAFATFTLQLAYAIRSEFSRVRSFVFIDGIEEVTGVFETAPDLAAVTRHINSQTVAVRLDGHSDYGMVLETFWDQWGPQVRKRTSVIVLGDARNNYHAPRSWVLKSIRERARHLYWLNPEPAYSWDTGDSIVSEYAKHCDKMVECRNLRQLKEFVEALD